MRLFFAGRVTFCNTNAAMKMLLSKNVVYKMKTWKQEFLVMVFISLLPHSDPGVKATWPIT